MRLRTRLAGVGLAILSGIGAQCAYASETVTYTYDAKGRLVAVVHSGTVNNGLTTQYTHDHVDNRTHVTTSGA